MKNNIIVSLTISYSFIVLVSFKMEALIPKRVQSHFS
jgi:hypothetical protein